MTERNLLKAGAGFNRCLLARHGYMIYNANDVYIGKSIEGYGEYSENEAAFLRQLCAPGDVIVEVGANIGAHTLPLAQQVGPQGFVYAYEPQRVVFQTLCANLALNSMVNVDARHAAVAATPGFVTIPDIDYTQTANFGGVSVDDLPSGRPVRKVRLDDDLSLDRLNLLKIDVEGMELEVLQGAIRLIGITQPLLYLENDRLEKSEALIRHVAALDYRMYWHLPPLHNKRNFFGLTDNLFPGTISINMLCIPRRRAQSIDGLEEILDPVARPTSNRPPSTE
jgi:FkbM family methyltransferase